MFCEECQLCHFSCLRALITPLEIPHKKEREGTSMWILYFKTQKLSKRTIIQNEKSVTQVAHAWLGFS